MTQRLSGMSAIGSLALATILAGTFVGYGCGDDEPSTPGNPDAPTSNHPDGGTSADGATASGTYSHYVTNTLAVGPTADVNALDIDGDGQPDDRLGILLITLHVAGFDVDATLATAVSAGDIVVLHSIKATSLTSASSATWQVYVGDPKENPDLTSGNGNFTVAGDSPTDAILSGTIAGGQFTGGPANVTLKLALIQGAEPITLSLHGAHLQADVTAAGCTGGKLAGGITRTDLTGVILPALATGLNDRIDADGTCKTDFSTCNSSNTAVLTTIDRAPSGNMNNQIEPDEIINNSLIGNFLVPDVDLLDANMQPGPDGTKESISIAVGFECTKAVFTASSEH